MNNINTTDAFDTLYTNTNEPQGLTQADIHRLFGTMNNAKTTAILQTIRAYCELVVSLHLQQETELAPKVQSTQGMQKTQTPSVANTIISLIPVKQAA